MHHRPGNLATSPVRQSAEQPYLHSQLRPSWWLWPLALLNPTNTALLPYGLTLTAILLTAFVGRRGDLRELLSRLVRWRVHPLWYLAAFGLPVILFGLPVLVGWRGYLLPILRPVPARYRIQRASGLDLAESGESCDSETSHASSALASRA